MLVGIPATEAEVETTDEGEGVVEDEELFVVRPVEGHVGAMDEGMVIGVAHYNDVVGEGGVGGE